MRRIGRVGVNSFSETNGSVYIAVDFDGESFALEIVEARKLFGALGLAIASVDGWDMPGRQRPS